MCNDNQISIQGIILSSISLLLLLELELFYAIVTAWFKAPMKLSSYLILSLCAFFFRDADAILLLVFGSGRARPGVENDEDDVRSVVVAVVVVVSVLSAVAI
jgi:hypothetical protein